jgi:hypothetical protein
MFPCNYIAELSMAIEPTVALVSFEALEGTVEQLLHRGAAPLVRGSLKACMYALNTIMCSSMLYKRG